MRWRLCRETTVTTWLWWGDLEAGMPPGERETELIINGRARIRLDSRKKTMMRERTAVWRGRGGGGRGMKLLVRQGPTGRTMCGISWSSDIIPCGGS